MPAAAKRAEKSTSQKMAGPVPMDVYMVSPCGMPWFAGRWLRGGGGTAPERLSRVHGRMQAVMPLPGLCPSGGAALARPVKAEAKACLRWIPSLRRHDPDQVLRVSASGRLSVLGWQGTAGADAPSGRTPPGTDVIIGMAVAQERAGIMVIPNAAQSSSTISPSMLRRRAYADALAYPRRTRMVGYSPLRPSVCAMRSASSGFSLGWLA